MIGATRLPKTAHGTFAGGEVPSLTRFSVAVRALRRMGNDAGADELEQDKLVAAHCTVHGAIDDPVIGLLGGQVAFACPWCSGDAVREQWQREGEMS